MRFGSPADAARAARAAVLLLAIIGFSGCALLPATPDTPAAAPIAAAVTKVWPSFQLAMHSPVMEDAERLPVSDPATQLSYLTMASAPRLRQIATTRLANFGWQLRSESMRDANILLLHFAHVRSGQWLSVQIAPVRYPSIHSTISATPQPLNQVGFFLHDAR